MKRTRKIVGSILLALGMVLSIASVASASNGGQEHREIVCHKTGNGYIPIPPDKASSHITSEGEHERGHKGDFLLKVTYDPKVDGKWSAVKERFELLCNGSTPTVTTVTPGPTVTVTVTGPDTTVTETVEGPTVTETVITTPTVTETVTASPSTTIVTDVPTVTATVTAEVPVTETETVVPTNTVTTTAPAVVETVTITPTNTTTIEATPKEIVKTVGSGRVVTKLVDSDRRVVAVEESIDELPYTGINMTHFLLGIVMVLAGTVLLMARKLMLVRA